MRVEVWLYSFFNLGARCGWVVPEIPGEYTIFYQARFLALSFQFVTQHSS